MGEGKVPLSWPDKIDLTGWACIKERSSRGFCASALYSTWTVHTDGCLVSGHDTVHGDHSIFGNSTVQYST